MDRVAEDMQMCQDHTDPLSGGMEISSGWMSALQSGGAQL